MKGTVHVNKGTKSRYQFCATLFEKKKKKKKRKRKRKMEMENVTVYFTTL